MEKLIITIVSKNKDKENKDQSANNIQNFIHIRASRGKHLLLLVRFPVQGRQPDELDVWTHTNDTMGSIRRQVRRKRSDRRGRKGQRS